MTNNNTALDLAAVLAAVAVAVATCPDCKITVYADDICIRHDGKALVCPRCAEPGADLPDASAWVVCIDEEG